ncbi:superoxide dismutase family protein [Frankia nepalensis]|uniref:superoxide dismutase family protein n=1 Tax=Frankia nepalensis TaxID=1836974 RepID=UPI0027DC4AC6|nr:superoxide dismutase family protein [Frankia nepalensis]
MTTVLALPILTACGSSGESPAASAQTPSASTTSTASPGTTTSPAPTIVLAEFAPYHPGAQAITYDPARVPAGADVAVVSVRDAGRTRTALAVRGLPPNQKFGAHAHANACGEDPAAAGSHYQHRADPKQPSVNPDYANPRNEIWLDFTTDAAGSARSDSTVDWTFGDNPPKSVVIHAEHTATDPGHAGQAGGRLACVDF